MAARIGEARTVMQDFANDVADVDDWFASVFDSTYPAAPTIVVNERQADNFGGASSSPTPSTTNALSVLQAATATFPSSLINQINSDLSTIFGIPATSSAPSTQPTRTRRPQHTGRPTDRPSARPHEPTRRPNDRPHTSSTSHSSSLATSTHTTHSTSTSSTRTIAPTHTGAANTTQEQHIVGSHPLPNAAVAGIASGLCAGAVLVGLAGIYIWRRKRAGKPAFRRSKPKTYPEVAWLYDPVQDRPESPDQNASRQRSSSNANLLPPVPEPRPGSVEMATSEYSPSLPPVRPSSPLLAPEIRISREDDPDGLYDRHSRPSSRDGLRLPARAISDENQGA